MKNLSDYLQESGYIFSEVSLDSLLIDNEEISASLKVNTGKQYMVNEIENIGNLKISDGFIQSYFGIKNGEVFSYKKFKKISRKTLDLPFALENSAPQLVLNDSLVSIKLNLSDARVNSFNGIIGVMPNNSQDDRLLITGDARILLNNSLGRGEMLFLEWRRLQVRTQSLKLETMYPYLLGTNFGIDGQIDFFRRDTTFQNFRRGLGVRYNFSGNKFLRIFYEVYSSESITRDLSGGVPEFFDTRTQFYGFAVFLEQLDYRFNPRKGYIINQKSSFGTKIIPESQLNAFLIDQNIPEKSLSMNFSADLMLFLPISSRMVFHHSWRLATIQNNYIFRNEVHRIGGFNSLRGFDEESIFASSYAISNVELRLLLEERSFLFAFVNGAFYEQKLVGSYSRDLPYGFGAGISLGTPVGILSVAYAVGARDGQGPEFRAAKIHFGFTNTF
jgi:outer membrane protein assembly factor BamA